jgi:hypothetical protein
MPRGRKRKKKTIGGAKPTDGASSLESSHVSSRSFLLQLPRALQVSCLGYLEQRGIAEVASTCGGLREFSALRVCSFGSCPCRAQSAHGIATTPSESNTWSKCSVCLVRFGCPLSVKLWADCFICDKLFCEDCAYSAGYVKTPGFVHICGSCENRLQED